MLDPVSGETIYASNGAEDVPACDDPTIDFFGGDDNNLEANLRRRKGKIMSCAKETIEHGKFIRISFFPIHLLLLLLLWLYL